MPNASRTINHKQSFSANKQLTINFFKSFKSKVSSFKLKPGFTLIELLVVMAILGIIASIVTYGMLGQQRKARDAQRKSDMQSFKKAMESAKTDCRGSAYYPRYQVTGPNYELYNFQRLADKNHFGGAYLQLSNLQYLKTSLQDPKYDETNNFYRYATGPNAGAHCPNNASPPTLITGGTSYWVARVKLETSNDPNSIISYDNCFQVITLVIANGGIGGFNSTDIPWSGDNFYYVCND